jgi:hypothetical protein
MNTTESEDGSVGPLREALMVCAAAGMTGILRITGDPGGAIHLADGRVAAIETPGAPGPEVLLLRSHRVTESAWDAAFAAAAAAEDRMSAEPAAAASQPRPAPGRDVLTTPREGKLHEGRDR